MPEASEFKLWKTRKWSNVHARSEPRLVSKRSLAKEPARV